MTVWNRLDPRKICCKGEKSEGLENFQCSSFCLSSPFWPHLHSFPASGFSLSPSCAVCAFESIISRLSLHSLPVHIGQIVFLWSATNDDQHDKQYGGYHFSYLVVFRGNSPWYNSAGWLGVNLTQDTLQLKQTTKRVTGKSRMGRGH